MVASRTQVILRPYVRPIVRWLLYFRYETHFVQGNAGELRLGKRVATANTLFNLSSGSILVDDYTIFGNNVMCLTGRHQFIGGRRAGLSHVEAGKSWGGGSAEVPSDGYDIHIGKGCWIASGSIILGGLKIGNHSIVAAGAVVSRTIPDHSIVAGIPARLIGDTRDL